MKKKVIIASILFALITPVIFGQNIIAGVKAGVDFPFFLGSDFDSLLSNTGLNSQFMTGFSGGVFLDWELFNYLAIQPELLYTTAGSVIGSGSTQQVTHINFLEIPILVKGTLGTGFGKFGVYVGPDFMFKVGDATFTDQNGNAIAGAAQNTFNGFIFNMVFGVDYNVPVGPGNAFIDVRYNLGITPLFNSNQTDTFRFTQNMVQVWLGYGVRIASY